MRPFAVTTTAACYSYRLLRCWPDLESETLSTYGSSKVNVWRSQGETSCYSTVSQRPHRCWPLAKKVENIDREKARAWPNNYPPKSATFPVEILAPPSTWFVGPHESLMSPQPQPNIEYRAKLESFVSRCKRFEYCSSEMPTYSLRERSYNKTLLNKSTHLNNDDLRIRMLYKDSY